MNKIFEKTDIYFLRSKEILEKEKLNPWVNMQVFIRKGPGNVFGIKSAIETILENSNLDKVDGVKIYAKKEGQEYDSCETVMNIVAPIQEIVALETIYLGMISSETTRQNDNFELNYETIGRNIRDVVELAKGRPVLYFGARHWDPNEDSKLAMLAYENGCSAVATMNGGKVTGLPVIGTIPHALENVLAYVYGEESAVKKSTMLFDKHMNKEIPRVALVDYNNKEITDSLETAIALNGNLAGVRIDTCGENLAEGALGGSDKYMTGSGVTTSAVAALRNSLNRNGFPDVKIYVSSGFSNPEKVRAFNSEEERLGLKLYDAIGAGFLDGVRTTTADIVAVGESPEEVDFYQNNVREENILHKVGRPPRPNYLLERII